MSKEPNCATIDEIIERALFVSGFDSKQYLANLSEEDKKKLEIKVRAAENLLNQTLHETFELCSMASHNDKPLSTVTGEDKRIISAYAAGALFATRIHFDENYQSFSPKLQDIWKRFASINKNLEECICETAMKKE